MSTENAPDVDPATWARVVDERAANVQKKAALGRGAEMAAVTTFDVPSDAGRALRCRLLVPDAPATGLPGVLVYLHGGGWVLGSIDTFDRLGRELAHRSGWAVLMVDYAKSPEHRFPVAVGDARAALAWASDHAAAELARLGTPTAATWRLAIGGDSAGGNLAAVASRQAASDGARLDAQVLIYPVTDCDLTRPSYAGRPDEREGIATFWRLYTGHEPGEAPTTTPDASPLRASTLAGQAPALVINAEHDCLNSEITAYAERLAAEGVAVTRHTIADAPHGIISYYDAAPQASEAIDVIAAWLHDLA